ncbi:phosphosulfolactate phosphohydrolase [Microbacterium protaetiae]|uniref:Probable 2-phosphosulfolactate phosphatase n=1 Tax=Microbacterium protaetiae TaxID=2509458 RepID=A0A4P6ED89_9MICO|nr:2-phosphosulfolactate phosphatase [Microbacterium protaetiae]QAY60215.1 phosphosulfolactate phosphohydrolase [Microbacterium protaetiae]
MPVFDQSFYQVRLEWGIDGLARLQPADVVVVVDVLRFTTAAADAASRGESLPLDHSGSVNGAPLAAAATGALVMAGSLRNAGAVARRIFAEQQRRGGRVTVAVLPAGERAKDAADAIRFAIEDQLGAGAIIAALSDLGIDHISPEAAVACESFRALRGAVRHLLTASGSGQELIERGLRDDVLHAAELDAVDAVPVLREGAFGPA